VTHHIWRKPFISGATTLAIALGAALSAQAAPVVSRLTPPSELFATKGVSDQVIARFMPDQHFDLQATIRPDTGTTITKVEFIVDGRAVQAKAAATSLVTTGLIPGLPAGTAVASVRAYSNREPGVHELKVVATQSDGQIVTAKGNFEVHDIQLGEKKVKNIILLLGDGMGATHRTAARIMAHGYAQGKAKSRLSMDTFPVTGMVMTASLNSIVTDSAPGMSNYVTGNKANNNQEGVFPDDTLDAFDNPRVEYLSEYLHRTQGKALGIVTTSDVFDATPAANAIHTSNRGAGTGIVDQFLDDRHLTGLSVLMGGGRKWFLPNASGSTKPQPSNGSQRTASSDYVLPSDIVAGWNASPGVKDPARDLIADFQSAGFTYAPDYSGLKSAMNSSPDKLLGLFSYSNMNVALDKISKRRGTSTVVDDYGFPDQPMLDEMASAAIETLSKNKRGFYLMIEGASIDKQSHNMDSDRWMVETLEFDRAVKVAQDFAAKHKDTLVIVTADHECSGAAIIGAATKTVADITAAQGKGAAAQRDAIVGVYDAAKFPSYAIRADGYPESTDIDYKMLIGYGANADRYETWLSNPKPTQDTQQPFVGQAPLSTYPANPSVRNATTGYLVTGQVPGDTAVHTGSDIPLSAYGRGARLFTGLMDNTDVFFRMMQAVVGGTKFEDRERDERDEKDED
jgi:alkaline phosphatase